MTLALRSPQLVGALISIENSPVDVALKGDFTRYIQGMKRVEEANLTKHSEAGKIFDEYEKVLNHLRPLLLKLPPSHSPVSRLNALSIP